MRVFEDFFAYADGIYSHVAGDQVAAHAVCVVGYDDDDKCWIVKNSWGPAFGEEGYFRLAYGQCGLDGEFLFFSAETQS
jgi:C1A family cysteine protease